MNDDQQQSEGHGAHFSVSRPVEGESGSRPGGVGLGFLWGVTLQIACIFLLIQIPQVLAPYIGGPFMMGVGDPYLWPMIVIGFAGVSQVLYMVPAYFVARRSGARKGVLQGFTLAAVLLFLMNTFCFGVMGFRN